MTLDFGKYKGYDLYDVKDLSYLKWLEEQKWITSALRTELQFYITKLENPHSSVGRIIENNTVSVGWKAITKNIWKSPTGKFYHVNELKKIKEQLEETSKGKKND